MNKSLKFDNSSPYKNVKEEQQLQEGSKWVAPLSKTSPHSPTNEAGYSGVTAVSFADRVEENSSVAQLGFLDKENVPSERGLSHFSAIFSKHHVEHIRQREGKYTRSPAAPNVFSNALSPINQNGSRESPESVPGKRIH